MMRLKIRLTPRWWAEARAYSRGRAVEIALVGMEKAEVRVTRTSLHVVIEPSPECTVAALIGLRDAARVAIEALGPKAAPANVGAP